MSTTAIRWRTRPQYTGHVADGYYLDSAGRLRFQPDPRDALDLALARMLLLDLDDDLPRPPAVLAVAIGGRLPRPENVRAIQKAVDELPLRFRSKWLAAGGRVEIVPGVVLPDYPHWLGVNKFHSAIARVAGDNTDAPQTARHEFAHGLDFALGYPSRSAAWLRIWQDHKAAGNVPSFAGQREKPEEFFAEQFARLWHPDLYPTRAAQDFIMQLV